MMPKALSAGVVVVRWTRFGEPRYLLLRAYKYWDFPKGEVAAAELPLDAAVREVREETGLLDLRFAWGNAYIETEPYGRGKVARYYVAESPVGDVTLPVNPDLGRPEHHAFRWVSLTEGLELLVPRVQRVLRWAHVRVVAAG